VFKRPLALLASARALTCRARSVLMNALMTPYSMLSVALAGAVAKYHTGIK